MNLEELFTAIKRTSNLAEGFTYLVYPKYHEAEFEEIFKSFNGKQYYQGLEYFTLTQEAFQRARSQFKPERFSLLITFSGWEEGQSPEFIKFVNLVQKYLGEYELS